MKGHLVGLTVLILFGLLTGPTVNGQPRPDRREDGGVKQENDVKGKKENKRAAQKGVEEKEESYPVPPGKWIRMFDGKTLDGWEADRGKWRVDGGVIVGTHDQKGPFASLRYAPSQVTDFFLEVEMQATRGRFALRKWLSFTMHYHKDIIPAPAWHKVQLLVRGTWVRVWVGGKPAVTESPRGFDPGTNSFYFLIYPGAELRIRSARMKVLEPLRWMTLFNGKNLDGWQSRGVWHPGRGTLFGQGPALLERREAWGDGILSFEVRGLKPRHVLIVLLNIDYRKRMQTVLGIPGSEAMKPQKWYDMRVQFLGGQIVLEIGGGSFTYARPTRTGPIALFLRPGSSAELRNIRAARL